MQPAQAVQTLVLRTAAHYGDGAVELELPAAWQVEQVVPSTPPPLAADQLRQALAAPVGQPPLSSLARGVQRPLIVVDDLTRPTPTDLILPHVLDQLASAGVQPAQVTLLVAIGAHGPPSPEALARKLGSGAAACRTVVHDMTRDLVHVGRTSFGTPVEANRALLESDFVLGIGGVYPQHSVGFGGGAKLLLGTLGQRSIVALHYGHASLDGHYVPDAPFRRDLDEIARLLRLRTLVSVHVDAQRHIVRAVSGDHTRTYPEAVAFAQQAYRAPPPGDADVVIANAYPMDVSLTFARSKGMLPLFAARPGASRVVVAGCPEGLGCHRLFPFGTRLRRGTELVRRASITPAHQVPRLVAERALRRLRRLRRPPTTASVAPRPVWIYCTAGQPERLGPLPAGYVARGDWPSICDALQREQAGHQPLRVLVYACAPLQVLE